MAGEVPGRGSREGVFNDYFLPMSSKTRWAEVGYRLLKHSELSRDMMGEWNMDGHGE